VSASQQPGGRSRLPVLVVAVVLVVLAVGIGGVAYMFSGSAPAAVSLATSGPAAPSSSSAGAASASSAASASPASSAASAVGSGGGSLDGTWNVDTSIGSFSVFSDSFVGYRVNENLAQVGSTTAVGRTPKVSGSLTFAGNAITAATITADLTALQSDKPMRDGQLQQQGLQTAQFPTATFVLGSAIQLPGTPVDGQTISVTATGKLTLHGVTNQVSIPLQAKLSGTTVTVVGTLPIRFADYTMTPPHSMMVLSVDDHGTLELQLHFTKG
jgi:polyisoprenoid-binding protein YceI